MTQSTVDDELAAWMAEATITPAAYAWPTRPYTPMRVLFVLVCDRRVVERWWEWCVFCLGAPHPWDIDRVLPQRPPHVRDMVRDSHASSCDHVMRTTPPIGAHQQQALTCACQRVRLNASTGD